MARTKYLTRTIKTVEASVLVLDLNTLTTEQVTISCPGSVKTDKDILKVAAEVIGEDKTAVKVVSTEAKYNLYRIKESDFIAAAELVGTSDVEPENTDNE